MKVAIVCDSMSAFGGAERVVAHILQIFPDADLFSVLDVVPAGQRGFLEGRTVRTSFLQKLPKIERYYRKLLYLWPLAVEQLDVTAYDLVISSHHSVAYGVLTRPGQVHVSYVHSPMRYAWDLQHEYLRSARLDRGLLGMVARTMLHKLRVWDYAAAQRPDAIAANSHFVAERLLKTHRRRSTVIHPPVALASPDARERAARRRRSGRAGYYLSLGRLVPYKRVDLLALAFARMPHRSLKIVGDGPDLGKIAALGAPNVEILGYQPEDRVRDFIAGAEAYLFAGIEDFGITAVEAQALGTPVIAYRAGGLAETVVGLHHPSPTGLFFAEQSEEAVVSAIEAFETNRRAFTPAACIANAERFSAHRFRDAFSGFVEDAITATRDASAATGVLCEPPRVPPRTVPEPVAVAPADPVVGGVL
ncbi:MAG TPA: glycosyltransferase [Crenalkalicoccus sp.]|nr:glycosyltransferase [Crenalkalicoccus sp.]